MISRRAFIVGVGALGATRRLLAGSGIREIPLPAGIGVEPDFSGSLPPENLGKLQPMTSEVVTAEELLAKAPTRTSPIEVARYFADIADGKYGVDKIPYASGWPVRWNPLIVRLFTATQTEPSGDE